MRACQLQRSLAVWSVVGAIVVAMAVASCSELSGDSGGTCEIGLVVETPTPLTQAPVSVRATANMSGFLEVNWVLNHQGQAVSCIDDSAGQCIGRSIVFVPEVAGLYEIAATGFVGGQQCNSASRTVNVGVPGAPKASYQIVVTPMEAASPLVHDVVISGGADFHLGELQLAAGSPVSGTVADNGARIESHLIVRDSSGGRVSEAFSDATGFYAATFPLGELSLDVVPIDPTRAPGRLHNVLIGAESELVLPLADSIMGSVRGPTGAGLDLASISIALDGLPSSLATSGATGFFSIAVRKDAFDLGTPTTIAVQPPDTSGLPTLRGPIGSAVAAQTVNVDYTSSVSVRTRTFTVTGDGGNPVANAEVLFVSEPLLGAAMVQVGTGAPTNVDGRVTQRAATSASGVINSIVLADANYTVYVSPPAGPPSVLTIDATGASTPMLVTTALTARLRLRTLTELGVPDPDVRVVARPSGALGSLAPVVTAASAADGTASLDVVAGGQYDVRIYRRSSEGLLQTRVQSALAPQPGGEFDLGDLLGRPGRKISGTIVFISGAQASRAHVAIHCVGCEQPGIALAETVATELGQFVLLLPDPDLVLDF